MLGTILLVVLILALIGAVRQGMARHAITAPLMNDGRSTKELFDELYDGETGLPK